MLAEFGPEYADLSERELLRNIRRHAPDALLEKYNLEGQIYNSMLLSLLMVSNLTTSRVIVVSCGHFLHYASTV